MVESNAVFEVITPDEVAECWDGVFSNEAVPDLYEQLWALTKFYEKIENIEDIGPHDMIGINSVAGFWSRLAPATQVELNRLAAVNDSETYS